MPELLELIRKAVDSNRLMCEPVLLGEPSGARDVLIGQSAAMQAVYKKLSPIRVPSAIFPKLSAT
jgi:hypothetical protein